jgi:EAL domain-containing protein (putative c-di-GMP-specific phosphodiesterase class I)
VIAEGIDGPDQLDLLRTLGCNMGQGYFLAWPASAHDFETTLASGGLLPLGPSTEVGFGMGL